MAGSSTAEPPGAPPPGGAPPGAPSPRTMDVAFPDAAFYFDLGNPQAYLAAERILGTLARPVEWVPVLAGELSDGHGTSPTATMPAAATGAEFSRAQIESRARELGLQPVRWPDPFPFDSAVAMLAATYAASIGRAVPFAQAAFRQAFAGGRSLAKIDNVLIAAAACEMHPKAVLAAIEMASVRERLSAAGAAASVAGVSYVPAVRIGQNVFAGQDAIEDAAAFLGLCAQARPAQARTR